MNNLRLMPDFTANNVATPVGEALAKLKYREIETEQVQFKIVGKHSAYGEIIGQSPAPDTYIKPEQKIILEVNAWGRRKIELAELLRRLSRRLQFPETRFDASDQLRHLLVDINASKPLTVENSLMEIIEQWFKTCEAGGKVALFLRKSLMAEPDEFLELLDNTSENVFQSLTNTLANKEFTKTLAPFISVDVRKKLEIGKSRFSFFQAQAVLNFERSLSSDKLEDWDSFKNFLVHVYARIELKENLTHEELLGFFTQKCIMPIAHEEFRQSMVSIQKNIQHKHPYDLSTELESERLWNNLTTDLALSSDQPTNLWHMQELFAKYLKLKPNEIELKIKEKKVIFTFPIKKSKKNSLKTLWLDYLFRPLEMEIDYEWKKDEQVIPIRQKEEVKPIIEKFKQTNIDDPFPIEGFIKGLIFFIILIFVGLILKNITFQNSLSPQQITVIQDDSQNLIRRYYRVLNTINPVVRYKKAVQFWYKPPSNFRELVKYVEGFDTPRILYFEIFSEKKAKISVAVRGKIRGNNTVHLYKVSIFVEKIDGKWKIKAINNRK